MEEPIFGKKTNAANVIPEEYQASIRRRLRQVREGVGIPKTNVRAISSGTLVTYENKDLSSLKLGDLWALAYEYGFSFAEMMVFLIGSDDMPVSEEGRNSRRLAVYLRSLPVEQQHLALDVLKAVVDFNAVNYGGPSQNALETTIAAQRS